MIEKGEWRDALEEIKTMCLWKTTTTELGILSFSASHIELLWTVYAQDNIKNDTWRQKEKGRKQQLKLRSWHTSIYIGDWTQMNGRMKSSSLSIEDKIGWILVKDEYIKNLGGNGVAISNLYSRKLGQSG